MTLANEQTAAGDDGAAGSEAPGAETAGKALEPSPAGPAERSSVTAFLDAAGERIEDERPMRPLYSKLLDYSAHAAMIIGLLGFAWTVSDHVAQRPVAAPSTAKALAAVAPPKLDETAELRLATQRMAGDIVALRASLETLRTSTRQDAGRQDKVAEQIHALGASLDGVKAGLNGTKAEAGAALAQLTSKVDHLQHLEAATKALSEKLDRVDHTDPTPTASIAPAAKAAPLALPPVKPLAARAVQPEPVEVPKKEAKAVPGGDAADAAKKPSVIAEWVVREVYDGVAVIESRRGPMEVVPGVTIPGAGVVKSIDRRGAGWTVTTSKGQIAYLPLSRDHSARDLYRNAPDDF